MENLWNREILYASNWIYVSREYQQRANCKGLPSVELINVNYYYFIDIQSDSLGFNPSLSKITHLETCNDSLMEFGNRNNACKFIHTSHISTTRTCDLSLVRSHLNRFYLKTLCTHQFARNRIYLVTRCNAKRKVWRINEWNKKKCRVKDERQMEMWHRHISRTTLCTALILNALDMNRLYALLKRIKIEKKTVWGKTI